MAIVLLLLLGLLLADLLLAVALADQVVERGLFLSRTLLALLAGLDELRSLLLRLDLGDTRIRQVVKLILLRLIKLKLVLVGGEVILETIILLVVLVIMVMVIGKGDVVACDVDVVGTLNREVDLLVLTDSDVERLLVVLYEC